MLGNVAFFCILGLMFCAFISNFTARQNLLLVMLGEESGNGIDGYACRYARLSFFPVMLLCFSCNHHLYFNVRMETLRLQDLPSFLQPRPADGHKGTFGHALLIAGAWGMAGASLLAGRACLRSGVGKLTMHIPRCNNDVVQMSVPEAIVSHDCKGSAVFSMPVGPGCFSGIGIGPGLGCGEETYRAFRRELEMLLELEHPAPCVLDADALNLVAMHADLWTEIPMQTILTPHLGEFSRLTGLPLPVLAADEALLTDVAFKLAERHGVVLVVKGHPTRIFFPDGFAVCCPWGNSGMATAGSGDVLTGIITGLLAQGYAPRAAACLGVSLHAIAGDFARDEKGEHSVIASDLIDFLPKAWKMVVQQRCDGDG